MSAITAISRNTDHMPFHRCALELLYNIFKVYTFHDVRGTAARGIFVSNKPG